MPKSVTFITGPSNSGRTTLAETIASCAKESEKVAVLEIRTIIECYGKRGVQPEAFKDHKILFVAIEKSLEIADKSGRGRLNNLIVVGTLESREATIAWMKMDMSFRAISIGNSDAISILKEDVTKLTLEPSLSLIQRAFMSIGLMDIPEHVLRRWRRHLTDRAHPASMKIREVDGSLTRRQLERVTDLNRSSSYVTA